MFNGEVVLDGVELLAGAPLVGPECGLEDFVGVAATKHKLIPCNTCTHI